MDNQTPRDERLEKQRAFVVHFLYWGMILAAVLLGIRYLLPALMPFVIAYIAAWALNRPITYLSEKTHIPRALVCALAVILTAGICVGLLTLVGATLYSFLREALTLLPDIIERGIFPLLQRFFEGLEQLAAGISPAVGSNLGATVEGMFQVLKNGIVSVSGSLIAGLGGFLTGVPGVFMRTIITLIATIFISIDFQRVRTFLLRFIPEKGKPVMQEAGSFFGRTVPRCLLSYVCIFTLTFLELWIGLGLLGIPSAGFVAAFTAVLDILPVLGTGTVLLPWALISLFSGSVGRGVGLLAVYLVITFIRNLLEPRLVGRQIRLHPVLTFAGMLIGLRFFGLLGLLGVPLTLAFLRQLHEAGIIHLVVLDPSRDET